MANGDKEKMDSALGENMDIGGEVGRIMTGKSILKGWLPTEKSASTKKSGYSGPTRESVARNPITPKNMNYMHEDDGK